MTMMMLPTDGPGGEGDDQAPHEIRVRAWGRRPEDAETLRRHAEIAATFRAMFRERVEQLCREA